MKGQIGVNPDVEVVEPEIDQEESLVKSDSKSPSEQNDANKMSSKRKL